MSKTLTFILKSIIFLAILWALMTIIAFCCRDDTNIYTRALMTELHKKDPIDIIFCGASHVSHGINPALLDTLITKDKKSVRTFCSGTPTQHPPATKAIIQETLKTHNELKEVWFECDFAVAQNTTPSSDKSPNKSTFLVANYLRDPIIKYTYLKNALSPKYYLNALIPIGRDTLLNLDPRVVIKIVLSKLSGDYYKNATHPNMGQDSTYSGRGCVLDKDAIKNGTFVTAGEEPIKIDTIGSDFYDSIREIKRLLDRRGVRLFLYSNPSSDFYLLSRANYDQYINLIRKFSDEIGVPYFDFSLAKPTLLKLNDEDFSDDNHLNLFGVDKFTRSFAFFYNQISPYNDDTKSKAFPPLNGLFYNTFIEKLQDIGPKVYGTEVIKRHDNSISVRPIGHDCSCATIEAKAITKDNSIDLSGVPKGDSKTFTYPPNTSGVIDIKIILNGKDATHTTTPYFWM